MPRTKGPHNETYEEFYSRWLATQKQHLKELQHALESGVQEHEMKDLVQKAAKHYAFYYRAKDNAASQNILTIFTPGWKTPLETAFMWIGGWRPSLVFRLAYAQAGQQIEAELAELISGIGTPTVASVSASQLDRISQLQIKTQKEEDELSHQEALLQQALAGQPLVGLMHCLPGKDGHTLEDNVNDKLNDLQNLLVKADRLRADTLQGMLRIFTTTQAAEFLVAAAQLQIAFRAIGDKKMTEGS